MAHDVGRYVELLVLGARQRKLSNLAMVKNRLRSRCVRGSVAPESIRVLAWMETNMDNDGRHFFVDRLRVTDDDGAKTDISGGMLERGRTA